MKIKKINEITSLDVKTKILVYPTDTVYGIGCNAFDVSLVDRIYDIKKRERLKAVSVIAPSVSWILENFVCDKELIDKYLPGAYTLILKKRDSSYLSAVSGGDSVGVRMIKHRFQNIVSSSGIPFVTTSANLSGEKTPVILDDISQDLKNEVDIIIDEGVLFGKSSKIIDFTGTKEKIIRE